MSRKTAQTPPLAGIKLAVFDLDGTLIDAFGDIAAAVNHMLARAGRPPMTLDAVKRHVGRGARMLVAGVLGTSDDAVIDRHHPVLVEWYKDNPSTHARVYEGVADTLRELRRRGIRTACISNKPDPLTRRVLEDMELAPLLDSIHGESARFPRKPAPDALINMMKEQGAEPGTTVVVGDTDIDIQFARAAGVRVIAVTHGQLTAAELEQHKPDYIVHSFAEVQALMVG